MTKFLFMDERYADNSLPAPLRATVLTGVLMPTDTHRQFRDRFYELVITALGDTENVISAMPAIHASELFPEKNDGIRFDFLTGIVDLIVRLQFPIYRIGYTVSHAARVFKKGERETLSLCFMGMLFCLKEQLETHTIWPVMEYDGTALQDQGFAGTVQGLSYYASRIGPQNCSIDNANLGEVLYTTKRSASGATVDCVAYLLHARHLREKGVALSPFKARLAEIADPLSSVIAFDEIIDLKQEHPPKGHRGNGPIRYVVRIEPHDTAPAMRLSNN